MSQPVYSLRYGSVSVAVWLNQTRAGVFYNVTATRSYRKDKSSSESEWESSHSFSDNDLPALALAVQDAYRWIQDRKRSATTIAEHGEQHGDLD